MPRQPMAIEGPALPAFDRLSMWIRPRGEIHLRAQHPVAGAARQQNRKSECKGPVRAEGFPPAARQMKTAHGSQLCPELASSTRLASSRRTVCVGEMVVAASSCRKIDERAALAGKILGHRIEKRTPAGSDWPQLSVDLLGH